MLKEKGRIFHICPDDGLRKSRDAILRFHGYYVVSTGIVEGAAAEAAGGGYSLVLIDATGARGVEGAEQVSDEIRRLAPGQPISYVCNHLLFLSTSCPDGVIRTDFDPEKFIRSVQETMKSALAGVRAAR